MKLEESTALDVLHSFLKTFGLWTCYPEEDRTNFSQLPQRARNAHHALSGVTPQDRRQCCKHQIACDLFTKKTFQN